MSTLTDLIKTGLTAEVASRLNISDEGLSLLKSLGVDVSAATKGNSKSASPEEQEAAENAQPTMFPLRSSNVQACNYSFKTQTLFIEYKSNGGTYAYANVPPGIFYQLMQAQSPGKYVWAYVRDKYSYTRQS